MHPRPSYFSTYSLAWSVGGSRHLSLGSDGTGRTARFSRPPAEYLVAFLPTSCRSAVNRSVAPLRFSNFDSWSRFPLLGRAKVQRFFVLGSYFAHGAGAWKLWRGRVGLTPKHNAK